VIVLDDRIDQTSGQTGQVITNCTFDRVKAKSSFFQVPAVVAAGADEIDFLYHVLTDIGNDQRVRGRMETESPRVSIQPVNSPIMDFCPFMINSFSSSETNVPMKLIGPKSITESQM
jgi:hypothetical protein